VTADKRVAPGGRRVTDDGQASRLAPFAIVGAAPNGNGRCSHAALSRRIDVLPGIHLLPPVPQLPGLILSDVVDEHLPKGHRFDDLYLKPEEVALW
jgi:hypothetical protein